MGIRCRGIDEIKTLAMMRGSGVHSSERHVRQFQVASLELERSRRMKERQANLRRIRGYRGAGSGRAGGGPGDVRIAIGR